jgi:hypothetical protein
MPKFRKKPVVIEAVEFNGSNHQEVIVFSNGNAMQLTGMQHVEIPTLEGTMRADKGDWIIKGVNGEFYPCKPDIFEKTYEPA